MQANQINEVRELLGAVGGAAHHLAVVLDLVSEMLANEVGAREKSPQLERAYLLSETAYFELLPILDTHIQSVDDALKELEKSEELEQFEQ